MTYSNAYVSDNYVSYQDLAGVERWFFQPRAGSTMMQYLALQDFIEGDVANTLTEGEGEDKILTAADGEEAQLILQSLEQHLVNYEEEIEASQRDMEARAEKELKLRYEDHGHTS